MCSGTTCATAAGHAAIAGIIPWVQWRSRHMANTGCKFENTHRHVTQRSRTISKKLMLSCQHDRSVLLYRGMATLTSSKIIHHGLIQNLSGIVSSVLMKRAKECMFCINRVANLSRRTRPSAAVCTVLLVCSTRSTGTHCAWRERSLLRPPREGKAARAGRKTEPAGQG